MLQNEKAGPTSKLTAMSLKSQHLCIYIVCILCIWLYSIWYILTLTDVCSPLWDLSTWRNIFNSCCQKYDTFKSTLAIPSQYNQTTTTVIQTMDWPQNLFVTWWPLCDTTPSAIFTESVIFFVQSKTATTLLQMLYLGTDVIRPNYFVHVYSLNLIWLFLGHSVICCNCRMFLHCSIFMMENSASQYFQPE